VPTPRRGVDEHALTGLKMSEVDQRVVGGEEDDWNASGFEKGPGGRHANEHAMVGHSDGRKAALSSP